MRISLAQIPNTTDIQKNKISVLQHLKKIIPNSVDLVLFPECALSGFSALVANMSIKTHKDCIKDILLYSIKYSGIIVLPSAFLKNGQILNGGLIIQKGQIIQTYFKEGLTKSEMNFFSVPDIQNNRFISVREQRAVILTCKEAQEDAEKYFIRDEVDFILWPSYWGWQKDVTWGQSTKENKIFHNMKTWKKPLFQSNFCFNASKDSRNSGPKGRSVVINAQNRHIHTAPTLINSGSIVEINNKMQKIICTNYLL